VNLPHELQRGRLLPCEGRNHGAEADDCDKPAGEQEDLGVYGSEGGRTWAARAARPGLRRRPDLGGEGWRTCSAMA
jgi:hypothetical protein